MKNKKAAMEMSVGTIVTVVLLMTVLIMGLVMVKNIFSSQNENVDMIDDAIKNQINDLYSQDSSKKIVVSPTTKLVKIQKGDNIGYFGFAVRNTGNLDESNLFSYKVSISNPENNINCGVGVDDALSLISLGLEDEGIYIDDGTFMEDSIIIRFNIPDGFPLCEIRYKLQIYEGATPYVDPYSSLNVDLNILSE